MQCKMTSKAYSRMDDYNRGAYDNVWGVEVGIHMSILSRGSEEVNK